MGGEQHRHAARRLFAQHRRPSRRWRSGRAPRMAHRGSAGPDGGRAPRRAERAADCHATAPPPALGPDRPAPADPTTRARQPAPARAMRRAEPRNIRADHRAASSDKARAPRACSRSARAHARRSAHRPTTRCRGLAQAGRRSFASSSSYRHRCDRRTRTGDPEAPRSSDHRLRRGPRRTGSAHPARESDRSSTRVSIAAIATASGITRKPARTNYHYRPELGRC